MSKKLQGWRFEIHIFSKQKGLRSHNGVTWSRVYQKETNLLKL